MILKPIHTDRPEDDSVSAGDRFSHIDQWLLQKIHDSVGRPPIRLLLGNGVEVLPVPASPVSTILIQDRRTLLNLLLDPELGFGDAYSEGRITVEGDLIATLEILYKSMSATHHATWYGRDRKSVV